MTLKNDTANIELGSDTTINDMHRKPVTLVCEIVADDSGNPVLKSFYPYRFSKETRHGQTFIRADRQWGV